MSTIILPGQHDIGRRGFQAILPSSETGGTVAVVKGHMPAATAGPPLHLHPNSDETYLVQTGTLLVHIDGEVTKVGPGGIAHITRGTSHTYATTLDGDAHFLTLHVPGGYEGYHMNALRAEQEKGGPLSPDDLFELAQRFDWQLAGSEALRLTPAGVLVEAACADDVATQEAEEARSARQPA
jgi:mannose-6-phosphate isomerase-like protein (cupin superfamily)